MGWFSPVKGSYPSLAQVDKTLPVANTVNAENLQRGTIVALIQGDDPKSDGVFKIAGSNDTLYYVSLQDYNDPAAGYAGTTFSPVGGVPAINGIDLAQDGEYETSVFDTSVEDYAVGDALTAKNGFLTKAAPDDHVIGYVTRPVTVRRVNNAIALPDQKNGKTDPRVAIRTGANVSVIRFKTAV